MTTHKHEMMVLYLTNLIYKKPILPIFQLDAPALLLAIYISYLKDAFYLHFLCMCVHRYAEGAEKYLSVLDTDDDISPFVLRIRSDLCYCYSKVHLKS